MRDSDEILEYLNNKLYYLEKNVDTGAINHGGNKRLLGEFEGKREILNDIIEYIQS